MNNTYDTVMRTLASRLPAHLSHLSSLTTRKWRHRSFSHLSPLFHPHQPAPPVANHFANCYCRSFLPSSPTHATMRRDKSNHVTSGSDEDLSSTHNQLAFPTIEDLILDVKKKTIESGEGTSVSPRGNTTKCASAPKSLRRRLVLLLLSLASISIITNLIIGDIFFQHESNNDEHSFSPPRVEQSPATLSTTKTLDKITTLSAARAYKLTPIQPASLSATHYTIRINTWRRNELLLASLNHHAKCEGVHSIQVIWCDAENDPPDEVAQHKSGKVIVERHEVNSLNERWRIMTSNTTIGILSLDDDVLRPCEAYDVAFIRWSRHLERYDVVFCSRFNIHGV